MTDLDTYNGHTETEPAEDTGKLTVQDFAAKVLSELKTLGPSDRLTVLDLIRLTLEDHWSAAKAPNLRAFKLAHTIIEDCGRPNLAQHTLSAAVRLLPLADRVASKSDVRAILDVQRQYVAEAAQTTKARSTVARGARKPKGKRQSLPPTARAMAETILPAHVLDGQPAPEGDQP